MHRAIAIALLLSAMALGTQCSFPATATDASTARRWDERRHDPSGMPAETWRGGQGVKAFADYVQDTRDALFRARAGLEPDPRIRREHVDLVAPYEWPLRPACAGKAGDGVLLVHGLTDSAFAMRDLGDALAAPPQAGETGGDPCYLVRSILLPGHGSVPGDLVGVDADQWRAAVRYGLASFRGQVQRVHVVGFSTGAALGLELVAAPGEPPPVPVASVTGLSPAVGIANWLTKHPAMFALLSGGKRLFGGPEGDWLDIHEDKDFAKYESFAVNGPLQLSKVQAKIRASSTPLAAPVFLAVSAEDATVDAWEAVDFFLGRAKHQNSRLLVYARPETMAAKAERFARLAGDAVRIRCVHGSDAGAVGCGLPLPPARPCAFGRDGGWCVTGLAHISVPVSPRNRHYGADGDYRNCLGNLEAGAERFCRCLRRDRGQDSALCPGPSGPAEAGDAIRILGEPGEAEYRAGAPLAARLSYNPSFDGLAADIRTFLKTVN